MGLKSDFSDDLSMENDQISGVGQIGLERIEFKQNPKERSGEAHPTEQPLTSHMRRFPKSAPKWRDLYEDVPFRPRRLISEAPALLALRSASRATTAERHNSILAIREPG